MPPLLAEVGLQVPPLLVSTLVKHFLSRKTITSDSKARDEFLYDQVCRGGQCCESVEPS